MASTEAPAGAGPRSSPLLTDLYELTMAHVYHAYGMDATAVFEFFVRKLPSGRGFLVAAGLELVLDYLENLRFDEDVVGWLSETGRYREEFVDSLREFEFTGDVHGMPEGTVFFPDEPIVRVTAPIAQAQIVESRLMNILHVHTLLASKAARCVLAAPDKLLVDFGMRRAHGQEAALAAARSSYVAGFAGSSNVLAERLYGIPSYGTMAHSFVQAHACELDAFERFALCEGSNVVLLIDTYDTLAGARAVAGLAPRLKSRGVTVTAVRLDSGDLATLAHGVRTILDEGGCPEIGIFASGGLDEFEVSELLGRGAPIDGFGVGTSLDVSADAPYLDCVYKIQEYAGEARRKRSTGKATWPGRKQVFRRSNSQGPIRGDTLALESEVVDGEPLVVPLMRAGRRLHASPELGEVRSRCRSQLARLPRALRDLRDPEPYLVEISHGLRTLTATVDRCFPAATPVDLAATD